jgi:hypothetical protein
LIKNGKKVTAFGTIPHQLASTAGPNLTNNFLFCSPQRRLPELRGRERRGPPGWFRSQGQGQG